VVRDTVLIYWPPPGTHPRALRAVHWALRAGVSAGITDILAVITAILAVITAILAVITAIAAVRAAL